MCSIRKRLLELAWYIVKVVDGFVLEVRSVIIGGQCPWGPALSGEGRLWLGSVVGGGPALKTLDCFGIKAKHTLLVRWSVVSVLCAWIMDDHDFETPFMISARVRFVLKFRFAFCWLGGLQKCLLRSWGLLPSESGKSGHVVPMKQC